MTKKVYYKELLMVLIGGGLYCIIEMLYRSHTHWTMFIVGGLAFYLIGLINELFPWEMSIWKQAAIGAVIVTVVEFISGVIINIVLGWAVWDYSELPFNILGQVSLLFCAIWFLLSIVAIVVDDWLRYKICKEEKPRYNFKLN